MEVRGFLEGLRGRLRRVLLLEGLAQLTVAVLVGCALAILLDYCWPIPAPARLALLLALIALQATVVYRRLLRPLARRMDDRTMAQLAERRIPGLDGRLLTRVDGIDLGSHDGQLLAAALTPQALTELIPASRLPGRMSLAVVLAGAAALIALSFPRLMHDGFNRLLLPFGAGEWERKAALAGELDRIVVAADDPLVVRIERTKGPQAPLRLSWTRDGDSQTERRMLSGLAGPWHQALTLAAGSYRLVAESGDALPLVLHGRLVKRPLLTHVQATLYPPHYISLPKQQLATLACTALPGSRLEFALEFALDSGREVAEAAITLGGAPLTVTRSARGLSGAFTIKDGGMLEIRLADQDGIGPNPQPRFPVTITEDRKPVVALDGPRNREAVTVRAQIHLVIDASDDYGLATLQLLTAVLAGEQPAGAPAGAAAAAPAPVHQESLAFSGVAGLTATTRKTVIDLSKLVKEGDRLQFTGRAEDANDISGPGVGLSQPLELKVVSESELRQELDRMLGEAKDRLAQAREELGGGLAKPERLAPASRGSALVAVKAGDLLTQVVRRWSENQLQEDQLKPAREAEELVNGKALLLLAEAVKGSEASARSADQLLSEAEKLLASMLQAGDLTRLLASIIEREKGLAVESRAFVMEYLTKPLDEAAKLRQTSLTQRQKELAELVKEIERRILALTAKQLEKAQELVRSQGPADQLQQAASALGSDNQRAAATKHQETAIATLVALLELLRGSDAAGDLAKEAGRLAARQEQLDKQLEEGGVPKSQEADQRKLHEDTEQFKRQLDKQPQAEKAVAAASQSQGEAEKAMAADDSAGAQREGAAAASLLREAQRQLGGEQEQKKKEEDKKKSADVLALLRELHHLQAALVADSLPVFTRLGDKPLDFAAQRDVPAFAEREGDILLRLREEGLKPVEKMPIVVAAMNRVALALEKSQAHLAQPALGTHGLRLEKIALAELARLIEIAENIPPPEKKDGDGKGGGNGNQAPFPPGAELALLAAMQEELSALTAAGRPVDLAGMQGEAGKLVELLAANSRPGSRPSLLLSRALRAMKSAGDNLSNGDRGLTTRHEQAAAEAALRRLMAEAKGGGGSDPKPQPQQKPGQASSKPPPASESTPSGTPGGNKSPASAKNADGKGEVTVVDGPAVKEQLLTLPQELREKLLEAHKQPLPPGALRIFERYLELLEEGK